MDMCVAGFETRLSDIDIWSYYYHNACLLTGYHTTERVVPCSQPHPPLRSVSVVQHHGTETMGHIREFHNVDIYWLLWNVNPPRYVLRLPSIAPLLNV